MAKAVGYTSVTGGTNDGKSGRYSTVRYILIYDGDLDDLKGAENLKGVNKAELASLQQQMEDDPGAVGITFLGGNTTLIDINRLAEAQNPGGMAKATDDDRNRVSRETGAHELGHQEKLDHKTKKGKDRKKGDLMHPILKRQPKSKKWNPDDFNFVDGETATTAKRKGVVK